MDKETLEPETLAQNASQLETVVELLNRPALARVYIYVCYWGPGHSAASHGRTGSLEIDDLRIR